MKIARNGMSAFQGTASHIHAGFADKLHVRGRGTPMTPAAAAPRLGVFKQCGVPHGEADHGVGNGA